MSVLTRQGKRIHEYLINSQQSEVNSSENREENEGIGL